MSYIRIYPSKARTTPTDPDMPWCAATGPDPRPETEPPRGIISRRTTLTPAQVVEIIRREVMQWRAAQ